MKTISAAVIIVLCVLLVLEFTAIGVLMALH
jgi:hypothetical protein